MAGRASVEILVDDDGPGIPDGEREAVFRPFYRLETSRNRATGGVGLGLTIARDIMRSHGGDLVLEASPRGGLRRACICRLSDKPHDACVVCVSITRIAPVIREFPLHPPPRLADIAMSACAGTGSTPPAGEHHPRSAMGAARCR